MGLILDTCIFIQHERLGKNIDFNKWEKYGSAFISSITASELLVGVHYATDDAKRIKRSAFVEAILSEIPIIDFTIESARIHAEIYTFLSKKGNIIGAFDLLIAATAIAHGHTLLTSNEKEFSRIPGLKVISP